MIDITPWQNSLWLCEPARLQQLATQTASYPTCFTARQIAAHEKRARKAFAASVADAPTGSGVDVDGVEIPQEGWKYLWKTKDGETIDAPEPIMTVKTEAPRAIRAVKGKIGVIRILGPVDQRASSALMKAGGTPLSFVSAALDALLDNPEVGAIVLDIDSPGGSSYGTQELSDKIFAARARKPIYAIANSMAASAGYWIASAASMLIATPGGDLGSIGVYAMHIDQSGAMEKDGIKVTMVSAGDYKTELAPFAPLSADAKTAMQEMVDATYDKFVKGVARNRGVSPETVRANYGKGRVMSADKALAAGAIDRILSMDDLMRRLTGEPNGVVVAGQRAEATAERRMSLLRAQHATRKVQTEA